MKKATTELFTKIFEKLKPPPDITLSEWADKYRMLSSESSVEPGRWKTSKAPYQREIMDAITDINVKKVVVMSAAQIGKTDMAVINPIGYYIHYDPSPMLVMQPTVLMGETFSKERLSPAIRDTKVLSERINDKSRNSGNTILQKIFPGGQVTIVGANSPSSLASRPVRILLADEIDRYPPTAGNEGDPLMLAEKRLTTYWNRKEVNVSTPTIKNLSRIEAEFEHSTQEHWHLPCPQCGALQRLAWSQIVFNKDDLSNIEMACDACGCLSGEYEWKSGGDKGKFVADNPGAETRGFHLNSLASYFVSWREVVEKFLFANEEKKKGNIEPLKVWTNTELGETWEEEGTELEQDDLYNRREEYPAEVPAGVLCLTAAVDTQDDRFEIEVVGWGVEKENWGIRYQVIRGDLKQSAVWNELDEYLNQTFEREDGLKLKIACTCIDSGGHFTQEVYRFCKARIARRIYAIKGKGGADVPYVGRPSTSNRVKTPLFTIGVDTGKSVLYSRLQVETEGANYCHFPSNEAAGYDEAYFKGLTAEKLVLRYKKGRPQYEWVVKQGHKRNEALDVRNYATAALEILNPVLKPTSGGTQQRKGRKRRSGGIK